MAKQTPPDDFSRRLRGTLPTQSYLREIQESIKAVRPFSTQQDHLAAVQESIKAVKPFTTQGYLAAIQEAVKPFTTQGYLAAIQESIKPFTTPSYLAEIQKSIKPFPSESYVKSLQASLRPVATEALGEQLRQTLRAFRPADFLDELAASLDANRDAIAGLSRAVAPLGAPATEWLDDLQAEAADAESELIDAPATLGAWLLAIPTVRQRRLLLLALAALNQVAATAHEYAGTEPPTHLYTTIMSLIAITALLSEWIDDAADPPVDAD